jgi:hypothetical protein
MKVTRRASACLFVVLALVATACQDVAGKAPTTEAAAMVAGCPAGFHPVADETDIKARISMLRQAGRERAARIQELFAENSGCINNKHPEPLWERAGGFEQELARAAAPRTRIPKNAYIKAIKQANRVRSQGQSSSSRNRWKHYGRGPLLGNEKEYTSVAGYGLVELSGRITQLAYTGRLAKHLPDTLLASVAYGGVWMSKNHAESWRSIGEKLPTQVIGAVGFTPARGGTIIALSGDGSFGRYSRSGAGAFYTTNEGKKWRRSRGLPSDALGFKIAVDPKRKKVVYAATGAGLYRSTNAGRSFRNTKLPTGKCKGRSPRAKNCLLANMVTDVVVKAPEGATDEKGGQVLAAVGWRGGDAPHRNGKPQSPSNGLYLSESGKPKTYEKLAAPGFAPQERIGRVELGNAIGPEQDHNYVYAIVQDAVLMRGGVPGIDAEGVANPGLPTVLNGIYVSSDFGQNWQLMADATELQEPTTGSALTGVAQSSGYGPGIQAWYNEWILPDPTMQVGGVPSRLLFGLEEVWMNENTSVPQAAKSTFKVIGRYYSGSSCVFLQAGLPACPTDRDDPVDETTTTHPDQQAAVFIPDPEGGATVIVGNDGGAYKQSVPAGADYGNAGWGKGAQDGLQTLFPYDAVIAKDGTAYAGLQDNGNMKITDIKKDGQVIKRDAQIQVYGGDGFFVGVDPHDSDVAYEEYTYGAMNATKDGGKTWTAMSPPGLDGSTAQFSTPFVLDPKDPNHVMVAGRQVDETGSGPGTSQSDWAVVYDLGTAKKPGNKAAVASEDDPANSMTAIDLYNANAYVGYCGVCSVLDTKAPFKSGIATNVGGKKKPTRYKSAGWHIAPARGLPERYINGVSFDPKKPKKVFVGLGGYSLRWGPPGALDKNRKIGKGHLFFSKNAGRRFKDVSGNLPNTPVNWVTRRGRQVIVATDVGVFITKSGTNCRGGCKFELLGKGMPRAPIFTVRVSACDPNLLTAAVYGRGVYTYRFGPKKPCPTPKPPPAPEFLGENVAGPFDFETDGEGWEPQGTGTNTWRVQPPGHESGQSYQIVPYTDDTTLSLVSPKFDLAERSKIKLSWFERVDTEPCCDYISVEWTSDGYVWHSATAFAGQNEGFPNFAPKETSFVVPKGELQVRFRLTSDALVSAPAYTGVAIDKILLER